MASKETHLDSSGRWMMEPTEENYPPDDKGRTNVMIMSDRELAEEQVITMRAVRDLVEGFVENFAKNPMFGMFTKMMGK